LRLAFASPLPPATSGIADYAAELLPALAAEGFEIALFHEGSGPPPESLRGAFDCRPIGELAARADRFDAILYQVGNSAPHHAGIYRAASALPGVVVLHEYMLHHLVRELTLDRGDGEAYVEAMRYAAGPAGERAARRLLDTHHPVDAWRFPLFEPLVDRSRGAIVHSRFAARRIHASRAAAAVEVVPFPVDLAALPPADDAARRAARAALGMPMDAFVVATFGFVTPHKRLEPTLAAFARLRERMPAAELWICGEVSPHFDLAALLAERGGDGVRVTGRLGLDEFHAAMRGCDVAVNLRHPTGGETSASLLRLLGSGVPTLVTDTGSFAELPDGVAAKVPIGEEESELIFALLARLAADGELRRALGGAARDYVHGEHSLARSAAAYAAAVRRLAALDAPPAPAPPLARGRSHDPRLELAVALGAAAVDLGRDERDGELLADLAATVAELGWAPGDPARRP
jgi:glycosyltransferase involved in cell wall biosynthesis